MWRKVGGSEHQAWVVRANFLLVTQQILKIELIFVDDFHIEYVYVTKLTFEAMEPCSRHRLPSHLPNHLPIKNNGIPKG